MRNRLHLLFPLLFCGTLLPGQTAPFERGVNLTNWFQAGSAQEIQFSRYTLEDFENIQSLGCDVIRLPINLLAMTSGAPDYTLDPLFLTFLDQAVDWAEEVGIYLILDNHTFDPNADTPTDIGDFLLPAWEQLANRYKDRSELILYEVLNEPHGISDALWGEIQGQVIDRIRTVDDTHTIVVGPAAWNSFHNLSLMPAYDDDNLLYTFHFYEPFLFTHQGAGWTDPSLAPLAEVPFPHEAGEMPPLPPGLENTWIMYAYNEYPQEATPERVRELIDIAVAFREEREAPLFCGEFGVYIPNSPPDDRVAWYELVRTYLEENDIAWTSWDYHHGFGLFEPGGNDLFDHDLNLPLLEALGFNQPPQTPFSIQPDTTGFIIYDDQFGPRIVSASYGGGYLNYYNEQQPNYGERCIYWTDPQQYAAVGFDFAPNRDLSFLVNNGYALDLFVRGDLPNTSFDLRFLDTKTSEPNDHPWRIRVTISDDLADDPAWDLRWHHLHLPLIDFTEQGSWDDETWYNPVGAFDWSAIDRMEIVADQQSLEGAQLWFDHLQLTELDTAMINDASVLVSVGQPLAATSAWKIYPNPADEHFYLEAEALLRPSTFTLSNLAGEVLLSGRAEGRTVVITESLPAGMYIVRVQERDTNRAWVGKVVKGKR